jgi:hypothetical protein
MQSPVFAKASNELGRVVHQKAADQKERSSMHQKSGYWPTILRNDRSLGINTPLTCSTLRPVVEKLRDKVAAQHASAIYQVAPAPESYQVQREGGSHDSLAG